MTLAQQYAYALYEIGRSAAAPDAKRLVESLSALLERKGHRQMLPAIRKEFRVRSESKKARGDACAEVVLAREKDLSIFKKNIDEELAAQNVIEAPRITYDATLIGGYRIEHEDSVVDASYRTQLLSLYRKMIAA